jgi:hypothetical protein
MKIAIVILVALVVAFIVSVWIGARHQKEDSTSSNRSSSGWIERLEGLTDSFQARLNNADLHSPCLNGATFRIAATKACDVDVDASKANVRSVHVVLAGFVPGHPGTQPPTLADPGRKVNIVVTAKDNSVVPLRLPLDARNPEAKSIHVMRGGALVSLECRAATGFCEVELL